MADYTLRLVKGSELTFNEADNNFINAKTTGEFVGNQIIKPPSGFYVDQSFGSSSLTNSSVSATDLIRIYPFITGYSLNIDEINCWQTTATAISLSYVIYESDADNLPSGRLLETTPISSSAGTNPVSVSFSFNANQVYWVGMVTDGLATFRSVPQDSLRSLPYDRLNTTGVVNSLSVAYVAPGSAPSTWPSFSYTQATVGDGPKIYFRVA